MLVRYVFIGLILATMFGCKQSDDSKSTEPEIVREVVQPQDGIEKMQAVVEGASMPLGQLTTIDRTEQSSESFKGKALVLNYWATWCKPCMVDTPRFQETAAEFPNVKFVSISIDRDFETWQSFIQDKNWSGSHYWIGMNETNPMYSFSYSDLNAGDIKGVHVALPKYIIIGADGTIIKRSIPGPGTPNFKSELSKHLL